MRVESWNTSVYTRLVNIKVGGALGHFECDVVLRLGATYHEALQGP